MNYFTTITLIIQMLFVPAFAPLVIGWIRKIKAKMQNRQGAGITQPYKDIWKLFHKDEAVSEDASWVFMAAPYIVFAVTLLAGAIIPVIIANTILSSLGDLVVFIYVIALGTFFLALGGLDVGNAFGDIGSSREMTLAAVTEGGLLFALLSAAALAGSTNMTTMVASAQGQAGTHALALLIAGVAFFIALLAENARYPFDNPSTHLELTMVHEAMIIEHSGKRLGLMEWAAANKLMIFLVILVNVFFPWHMPLSAGAGSLFLTLGFVLLKVFFAAAIIALIESSTPKLRYFRLPELLFTSFALGLISLTLALL